MTEANELEVRRDELTRQLAEFEAQRAQRAKELREALAVKLPEFQRLEAEVKEAEAALEAVQLEVSALQTEKAELQRLEASAREHLRSLMSDGVQPTAPLIHESTLQVWAVVAVMGGVILLLLYVMISSLLR